MLAVAADPESNQPGRLAHGGPWWNQPGEAGLITGESAAGTRANSSGDALPSESAIAASPMRFGREKRRGRILFTNAFSGGFNVRTGCNCDALRRQRSAFRNPR
jgi:hypothetical protein